MGTGRKMLLHHKITRIDPLQLSVETTSQPKVDGSLCDIVYRLPRETKIMVSSSVKVYVVVPLKKTMVFRGTLVL